MISNKAKNMSSVGHINKSINVGQEGQQRFYDSCRAADKEIKKTGQYETNTKRRKNPLRN